MPARFNAFQGYNDKKEKEPKLCARELIHLVVKNVDVSHSCFRSIKNNVAELADVMHQYASFLDGQNDKVKAQHSATSTKDPVDNTTLVTLPAKDGPVL